MKRFLLATAFAFSAGTARAEADWKAADAEALTWLRKNQPSQASMLHISVTPVMFNAGYRVLSKLVAVSYFALPESRQQAERWVLWAHPRPGQAADPCGVIGLDESGLRYAQGQALWTGLSPVEAWRCWP